MRTVTDEEYKLNYTEFNYGKYRAIVNNSPYYNQQSCFIFSCTDECLSKISLNKGSSLNGPYYEIFCRSDCGFIHERADYQLFRLRHAVDYVISRYEDGLIDCVVL